MEVTFVNVLICKALFDPNEFSIDDAWKAVEEDWQRESHGEDWMDEAHLKDSVFEIADLWTDAVEVSAYVGFLRELYQCITHPVGDKHQWTEVRSVSFHGSSTGENSMTDSKLMTSHEMTTRLKTMPSFTHSLHVASQQNSPRARSDETLDGFGQDQESSLGSAGKKNPWSPIRALARMAHLAKERRKKKEQQQDGEEEHHSEWGKVSLIAQSTGKFMTNLHKHLDIHKEESEKALEKPKKPERHRITTGKLEGGRPIQLKRGHKIAFTKDPNFRGNPKIIPCSAHVWDHLVEGDEILVGYPTMKSSLRVVQKTMDMLHATIEHNFMLGEDEVLYIEGLSNHPRPQHGALLNSHHSSQAAGVHHTPGEYRKLQRDEQMAKFNAAKKEYTQFVALDGNTIDKGQIGLNPRSSAGLLYRSLANSSSASSEEQRRQAALNRALHSGSVSMEVGQPVAVLGRHVGPPSPSGKERAGTCGEWF
uniref:Uncharacterized protein n=1 Tax=Heterosigma akashiwo TaxID=2829 RepID=A0A7S3UVE4_HETAK